MKIILTLTAPLFLLAALIPIRALADELRLNAATLFSRSLTHDLRMSDDGGAIELDWGELIEDDGPAAGYSYQPNLDKLSPTDWIRKELIIKDPRADRAILLVGRGGELNARLNGRPLALEFVTHTGNYWEYYEFDANRLNAGRNSFELSGKGQIYIARNDEFAPGMTTDAPPPNRSARSRDAGKTWDYDRLGPDGSIDGEYYVRLFLDRFHSQGSLESPVVDLGNLAQRPLGNVIASLTNVRIKADCETSEFTRVELRVRSGSTAVPAAGAWSDWVHVDRNDGRLEQPRGRYLQVAVELLTFDPLESPEIFGLAIQTDNAPDEDWTRRVTVVENRNPSITRTSIPFKFEPLDHPRLQQFRKQFKLDDVVGDAKTELEIINRLAGWSSQQWRRGHLDKSYPAWDALQILATHEDGKPVGGFCQQFNLVLLQACESFGIPGRAVSIGAGTFGEKISRGGHEVVELWSNEFAKWIYVDGDAAWYFVDSATGIPCSLLELRSRQLDALRRGVSDSVRLVSCGETRHGWTGLTAWPPFAELRLIPRSNFLEQIRPLPLHQGMRGWSWTGHYVWSDERLHAGLLYGNRVSKPQDFEWTLNQAHFVLEPTANVGQFLVHVDTVTPSFKTFVARIDEASPQPVTSGFRWRLNSGSNRLDIRSVNIADREGPASSIVIKFQ